MRRCTSCKLLPSGVRKALGVKGAGHVVTTVADGCATLTAMAENLARIRALARPYAPKGRLASEGLIAARREEERGEAANPRGTGAGRKPGSKAAGTRR